MQLRRIGALMGAGVLLLGGGLLSVALATAPVGHKVEICHATNSDSHPYVQIEVDIASAGHKYLDAAGHASHTGPLWDATLKDQHIQWGDIIPSYDYAEVNPTFHFAGLNWDEDGQAILDAGCLVPGESVTPSEAPSFVSSVEAATDVVLPSEPNTATTGSGSLRPDTFWLLAAAFGVIVASVIVMSPGRFSLHR